ncbi:hypothetical protein C8F00_4097 [Xanthomonas vasicola]
MLLHVTAEGFGYHAGARITRVTPYR